MNATSTLPKPFVTIILFLFFFSGVPYFSLANTSQASLTELPDKTLLVQRSGLVWQHTQSKKIDNYLAMQGYISTQNISGWRLPTKYELYQLYEIFDLHQNGSISMDLKGPYWLVDETGKAVTGSWEIGDQCGPSRTYYPQKRGYIRLVREK